MEMHQELVILKAIISPIYTTKHKKCASFIRCGKKGTHFYYMPTIRLTEKRTQRSSIKISQEPFSILNNAYNSALGENLFVFLRDDYQPQKS